MDNPVIADMLETRLLLPADATAGRRRLQAAGPCILFFPARESKPGASHDVAVALREILRDYGPSLSPGLVADPDDLHMAESFKVEVRPTLVLTLAGERLESIPRVRDWSDYREILGRYLGPPGGDARPGDARPGDARPGDARRSDARRTQAETQA